MVLPASPGSNAAQVVYASGIASALGMTYLYDPSFALSEDPAVYEKLSRDIVISGALDHLQTQIVGHDFSFEPEDDTKQDRLLAKVLEGLTKQQRGFPQALYNLSRATFMGCAWGLMFPERRVLRLGDGKPREWTVIAKVRDLDKRRFRLTQVPTFATQAADRALSAERSLGADATRPSFDAGALGTFRWEFNRGWTGTSSAQWWTPLATVAPDERWIQHVPDNSERGLGYGYGLADDLYGYFWMKQSALRYGMQGLERWGQGFLVVTTKALRDAKAKGMSQAQALQQAVQVARTWRSENVAALDENSTLQLLDMPSTAEAAVREWIAYFDSEMVKRILAALQPTGGSDGTGSYSSAKVEEGSQESRVRYLRAPLEESWTHSVVRFLIESNRDNLRQLGIADLGRPRLRLQGREQRDVKEMIEVFRLARELGIPVRLEDFYSVFGLQPPNEESQAIAYPEEPVAADPFAAMASPGAKALPGDRLPVGEGEQAVGDDRRAA